MTQRWSPASWRERPARHIPADYPDPAQVARVEGELRRMPPLVFAGEARRLKSLLGDVAAGKVRADKIDEDLFARYLDEPDIPEVDLWVRSSGEQRLSNFLLWQSAYAELVFLDTLWPDFDRRHLWHACEIYASRDRRFGGALPNAAPSISPAP